jgi:hypothetical protein
MCDDSCTFALDNECDDGGVHSVYSECDNDTDCTDCSSLPSCEFAPARCLTCNIECLRFMHCAIIADEYCESFLEESQGACNGENDFCIQNCMKYAHCFTCTNTCDFVGDDECDDGGEGSEFSVCPDGTDCEDCGVRGGKVREHNTSPPRPPLMPTIASPGVPEILPPSPNNLPSSPFGLNSPPPFNHNPPSSPLGLHPPSMHPSSIIHENHNGWWLLLPLFLSMFACFYKRKRVIDFIKTRYDRQFSRPLTAQIEPTPYMAPLPTVNTA